MKLGTKVIEIEASGPQKVRIGLRNRERLVRAEPRELESQVNLEGRT
jgi:hypothetical protein